MAEDPLDRALQILLIMDYIFDWARDLHGHRYIDYRILYPMPILTIRLVLQPIVTFSLESVLEIMKWILN
jgi:hypothetical protein